MKYIQTEDNLYLFPNYIEYSDFLSSNTIKKDIINYGSAIIKSNDLNETKIKILNSHKNDNNNHLQKEIDLQPMYCQKLNIDDIYLSINQNHNNFVMVNIVNKKQRYLFSSNYGIEIIENNNNNENIIKIIKNT